MSVISETTVEPLNLMEANLHAQIQADHDGSCVGSSRSDNVLTSPTFRQYVSERETSGGSWRASTDSVRAYYAQQDSVVDSFTEADRLITLAESSTSDDLSEFLIPNARPQVETAANQTNSSERSIHKESRVQFAVNLSFGMNLLLFALKIAALAISGSIAVLSSVIDSGLDLFSATVIFVTNRYMRKRNRYLFPMGKQRLEPIAMVIIAAVMATAAIELVSKALQLIIADDANVDMSWIAFGLMISAVAIKAGLFLLCRALPGASMSALATDHANDVLSNSVAMLTMWIAAEYYPNADPIGAIIIGILIIRNWYYEAFDHVLSLAGTGASPQLLQQLTWVAMHHDNRVQLVDTVRAISFGTGFLVECDIVLPPEMPLHEAHDIGEALQHKLELLPLCDRAHVHLDYEADHGPEEEHKRL